MIYICVKFFNKMKELPLIINFLLKNLSKATCIARKEHLNLNDRYFFIRSWITLILLVLPMFVWSCSSGEGIVKDDEPVQEEERLAFDLTVYHLGNSLTRNIPLERLKLLFESEGGSYSYGMQLGGGHQLDQHLSKRNHGNAPGEGTYNTVEPYGEYDNAFKNFSFDAVVLQPYNSELDKEIEITASWPYFEAGALQAAGEFIDYARAKTEPGDDAWHRKNANTTNIATGQFYIYATWPAAKQVLSFQGNPTYAAFYEQPFIEGSIHCKGYFEKLVTRLNELHPELPAPVKLIPAGQVLAELDKKIRNGDLPGIHEFYQRNQSYYMKSRRNNNSESPYDPDEFQPENGVLNFYADNVHMNDQPHNGEDSGTIGSYCAALTVYAVLTGQSPVGLTAEPYEMFDEMKDEALIKAIQETVWEVVTNEPLAGVGE